MVEDEDWFDDVTRALASSETTDGDRDAKRQRLIDDQNALYSLALREDAHLRPPSPSLHDTHPDYLPLRIHFPTGTVAAHAFSRRANVGKIVHFVRHHIKWPLAMGAVVLRLRCMRDRRLMTEVISVSNNRCIGDMFHPHDTIHAQTVAHDQTFVSANSS